MRIPKPQATSKTMNKALIILTSLFILSGCGTKITVPIDQTLISEDKATVIIFNVSGRGLPNPMEVSIDNNVVGIITPEIPLKIEVSGGGHELYVERPQGTMMIQRKMLKTFDAGKVYYMKVWFDHGMWIGSLRIDPVYERTNYETYSYK